jgi:type II secretory pathway component PulF
MKEYRYEIYNRFGETTGIITAISRADATRKAREQGIEFATIIKIGEYEMEDLIINQPKIDNIPRCCGLPLRKGRCQVCGEKYED